MSKISSEEWQQWLDNRSATNSVQVDNLNNIIPAIIQNCEVCKSKDLEILFLRRMVLDLTERQGKVLEELITPKISNSFKPAYVNDKGEIVDTTKEDAPKEELQEIDIVNEVLGH